VFPTRFLPLPVNRLFGPPITVKYRQISTVKTGKNDMQISILLLPNQYFSSANQHLIIENQYFSNAGRILAIQNWHFSNANQHLIIENQYFINAERHIGNA
jgi:hypothetical protein